MALYFGDKKVQIISGHTAKINSQMSTVKGTYTFKDTLTEFPSDPPYNQNVFFKSGSNNQPFFGFKFTEDDTPVFTLGYVVSSGDDGHLHIQDAYYYEEDSTNGIELGWYNWGQEQYKTIDFGETIQIVSDEFYTWLMENTVVENEE